jgi:hypothetical protein
MDGKFISSYTVSYSRFTLAYPQVYKFYNKPLGRKGIIVQGINNTNKSNNMISINKRISQIKNQ